MFSVEFELTIEGELDIITVPITASKVN